MSTCRWRWEHNAFTAHGYPGADYGRFVTSKAHLWLLQDSHDPNDGGWDHTRFADINIPPHTVAELHAFVPSCDDNDSCTTDSCMMQPSCLGPFSVFDCYCQATPNGSCRR